MFLVLSSPGAPELKSLKLEMRSSFSSTRDTASSIGFFILPAGRRVPRGKAAAEEGSERAGEWLREKPGDLLSRTAL